MANDASVVLRKVCSSCGQEKELSMFPVIKRCRDGHGHMCAECRARNVRDGRIRCSSVSGGSLGTIRCEICGNEYDVSHYRRDRLGNVVHVCSRCRKGMGGEVVFYPSRRCTQCAAYPCFKGQDAVKASGEHLFRDGGTMFAAFGCIRFSPLSDGE